MNADILVLCLLLGVAPASATVHYVTVAGLGGEQDYEQRFSNWAKDLDTVLKGSGDVKVRTLSGAEATKAKFQEAVGAVAQEAKPEDSFVLVLIGHGSFDGEEYKFNVKGPDLTAAELASLCDGVPTSRQLVVNMTSASGGSVAALQKRNRGIISATKTGTEKNATVFARYWVEALRDPASDADKNEVITALEAYQYADQKTKQFFETQKRLATEHAVIEDTGSGDAVRAPGEGKGQLIKQFALLRIGATQQAAADPAKRKLLDQREQIEAQIDKLKYEKAAMPSAEYRKKMSALLLQLAQLQEAIDQ
jgi:hypothetical protein